MNAIEFCYTLQGFAELSLSKTPTEEQWALVKEKLSAVEYDCDDDNGALSPRQFTTWLRGFVEITMPKKITQKQWAVIREHLGLVFTKVTTKTVDADNQDHTDILEQIKKEADKRKIEPYVDPYIHPWKKGGPFPWAQAQELICASK